ncbi:CRISPR-associated protein Cas5 [Bariatricus massiliensis]|uniref:CRISPR-associated protein Cas5 n=1 Tax=Bariatricus massiliensis TaxID=1745713 RepID=A0ABS8DD89_9FIRM|nr:CRISPR-associated protein Cas5 [Bariatricus massiliensis]MCB7302500.1 CRISPR-associated protein Cas5 [Bariatricus massiliensis]MCB7373716.1 CRISPR-associated protein Cas5 [Bariatricus massiliensis]MCB7386386.1 CRISPR-associated protein Cas5 [Bariatricus massiliensis]MCB7410548.1 CRISPR-associated protein Cas5 [Bariatricus massiliensis]MCQ5253615.1 CRISPR-associated protein Cas5 [Bariatricus massiliensis]
MKAIKIEAYQQVAQYSVPGWTKRKLTYPLPPYSTVIGMVHAACGWDTYHPMQVSISGTGIHNQCETQIVCKGWGKAKTESEEFVKRWPIRFETENENGEKEYTGWVKSPAYEDYLSDVKLILHIVPENQNDVEEIYDCIMYPKQFLTLGRHSDIIRIDNVSITEFFKKFVRWDKMWSYVPISEMGPLQPGIAYTLNKNYIIKNGRRIFTKIRAMLVEPDPEWPFVLACADTENIPLFLA